MRFYGTNEVTVTMLYNPTSSLAKLQNSNDSSCLFVGNFFLIADNFAIDTAICTPSDWKGGSWGPCPFNILTRCLTTSEFKEKLFVI